jgi:hypothetical protein
MSLEGTGVITVVVLQKGLVLRKDERGSSSDTCVPSTVDGNQVTGIEGERVSSVTEEEDQGSAAVPEIKTEPTVSGVPLKGFIACVYVSCFCAAYCSSDRNILSAFSTFTYRPVCLQWTDTAYGVYGLSL